MRYLENTIISFLVLHNYLRYGNKIIINCCYIIEKMKNKYKSCGLNYDLIVEKYHDLNEYEEIVNTYLDDEFFMDLKMMIDDEDYAMAKDAVKGLYILASDLCLYPLYERLLEIYEDLEYETYDGLNEHHDEMMEVYKKIRGMFNA